MTDSEESPAQRQARIRREKRENKLKTQGQDRLDKITRLSGRAPGINDTPLSTPPRSASPAVAPATPTPIPAATNDGDQLKAQEELFRALLRGQGSEQEPLRQTSGADAPDPMLQMMNSMLGGLNNDPNAPNAPALDPGMISKATGLPPFVTNMLLGKQDNPPTPEQQREDGTWTVIHIMFAVLTGIYLLYKIAESTATYGQHPPAPATFQNPFVLFVTGESILHGARSALTSGPQPSGLAHWYKTLKDLGRDASILVFLLGVHTWWRGLP